MKQFYSLPALLALSLAPAYAQDAAPDFASADVDGDGYLNVEEAQAAFPGLAISDIDGDGMLSQTEVEAVLPGLTFSPDGSPAEEGAMVGEAEYQTLVQAIQTLDGSGGV